MLLGLCILVAPQLTLNIGPAGLSGQAAVALILTGAAASRLGLGRANTYRRVDRQWLHLLLFLSVPSTITSLLATGDPLGLLRTNLVVFIFAGAELRVLDQTSSVAEKRWAKSLAAVFIATSCLVGISQTLGGSLAFRAQLGKTAAITQWSGWFRANGLSRTSQDLAAVAALALTLTWGWKGTLGSRLWKLAAAITFGVTLTRGAWIAGAAAGLVAWVRWGGRATQRMKSALAVALLGFLLLQVDPIVARLQRSGGASDVSYSARLEERWPRILHTTTFFEPLNRAGHSVELALQAAVGGTVDNTYLFFAVLGGWLSMISFTMIVFICVRRALHRGPSAASTTVFVAAYAAFVDFQSFAGLNVLCGLAIGFVLTSAESPLATDHPAAKVSACELR